MRPPKIVRSVAQRALQWRKEYRRGGTAVGVHRAVQLMHGQRLSEETLRRMKSYFARHAVDRKAEGFRRGEKGFPSAGRIAWDLWGGDPALRWLRELKV